MFTNHEQFHSWLEGCEDEHIEFKKAKHRFDFEKLVKYCCAFANEGGGKIVLGVIDKKPRTVVGSNGKNSKAKVKKLEISKI